MLHHAWPLEHLHDLLLNCLLVLLKLLPLMFLSSASPHLIVVSMFLVSTENSVYFFSYLFHCIALFISLFITVCAHLKGLGSLFLISVSWGSNSGCWVWQSIYCAILAAFIYFFMYCGSMKVGEGFFHFCFVFSLLVSLFPSIELSLT